MEEANREFKPITMLEKPIIDPNTAEYPIDKLEEGMNHEMESMKKFDVFEEVSYRRPHL